VPSFDLTVLSEWASIAGFLLSIWVLVRTYQVEKAVQKTESAIYRRFRGQDYIRKVDDLRKDFHTLALTSGSSEEVPEAPELFGKLDAVVSQLRNTPDRDIKDCLRKIDEMRYRKGLFRKIRCIITKKTVLDMWELLATLKELLSEYDKKVEILGSRQ
jgi:hypothetical protein